ncbi:major facilitator superfamily domain-containing protein 6-A-like [Daphnia carinata]|uniref:major facilitator superfamily domain-containing protein 6-A-like n=1 Tax=Daphnia carinata TaxID=120202 RepID=UPI00257AACA9|nr:major facilitator superfamily domain-containing protein 6-A-like [Daphnia carinata]
MEAAFLYVKSAIFPINLELLKLKTIYFLFYSSLFASLPYVSIISTQIVNYQQLSIIFSCVTVISTVGPIVTGFVADKLGIYKPIIITAAFIVGFIQLPILWLETAHKIHVAERNDTVQLAGNVTLAPSSNAAVPRDYIFPILLMIRVVGFIFFDAATTLLDAAGLAMTKKHQGDFAKQKTAGFLSMIFIPVLCGLLIDAISDKLGYKDYSIAFYIATGFIVILMPILYRMEVEVQMNKQSIISTAKKVVGMIDVDVFLLAEIFVGSCMGFHMAFLSVYVDVELIASKTLYGLASSCGGISAVISLSVAKPIIDRLGEANTLAFGLALYSVRFVIFYFLQNPWILIVTESLEGFCGFLGITTGSYFCAAAAPPGMLASLNGILAAATMGLGRGLGTAVGSFLISSYGIRLTYLLFAILSGSIAILYLTAYHLVLKKMERRRLAQPKRDEVTIANANGDSSKGDIEATVL